MGGQARRKKERGAGERAKETTTDLVKSLCVDTIKSQERDKSWARCMSICTDHVYANSVSHRR